METDERKQKMINILNQLLDGVMFHTYHHDVFCLLNFEGLTEFHKERKEEEEEKLNYCKKKYIELYNEIPMLHPSEKAQYKSLSEGIDFSMMDEESKTKIAYEALQRYKKWETEALNSFIAWGEMDLANGVMEELKEVNAALNILDENGINYDNMLYISNHIG